MEGTVFWQIFSQSCGDVCEMSTNFKGNVVRNGKVISLSSKSKTVGHSEKIRATLEDILQNLPVNFDEIALTFGKRLKHIRNAFKKTLFDLKFRKT